MPATVLTASALLLDMDGTLVNSDAVVERCWRRWALREGLDPEAALKVVHVSSRALSRMWESTGIVVFLSTTPCIGPSSFKSSARSTRSCIVHSSYGFPFISIPRSTRL